MIDTQFLQTFLVMCDCMIWLMILRIFHFALFTCFLHCASNSIWLYLIILPSSECNNLPTEMSQKNLLYTFNLQFFPFQGCFQNSVTYLSSDELLLYTAKISVQNSEVYLSYTLFWYSILNFLWGSSLAPLSDSCEWAQKTMQWHFRPV